jgi:MFS transporter, PAT family, beta-lactamase induction signal transducer AmpG
VTSPTLLEIVRNRRVGVMLPLGFASGLPLALTAGTLQAWLTTAGVDLRTIGILTLVGLPYTLKFLWAPVMDRFVPPWLGRRRGWMIAAQLGLLAGIAAMAESGQGSLSWVLGGLALLVAFLSASQDIAFDAYRADLLRPAERGLGAATSVTGYRIGMLVSGALALILSDRMGWYSTYLLMACLMSVGIISTLLGPEPDVAVSTPKSLEEAIVGPLEQFFSRSLAPALLLLLVLYKIGDAFAGSLTTAFLIRGVGFSPTDVGMANKALGLIVTIIGALAGGALMTRMQLFNSLLVFGILQAVSNLSFMVLAAVGKSYPTMIAAVAFENLAGGMGTAAFVALMMALCDHRYTATQYALFSAIAAVGRVLVGPPSGYLVEAVGWQTFFFLTFLAALPGLVLLWWLREHVSNVGNTVRSESYATH